MRVRAYSRKADSQVRIVTIEHPLVKGYPNATGAGRANDMSLTEALETNWPTDRHFQAIEPWIGDGAVRRVNVAQLTDAQLAQAPVRMVLRVLDVDMPGHAARTAEWTEALAQAIAALPGAKPLWYTTRGGARLLWALPEGGFLIDSRAKYKTWVTEQAMAIRQVREEYGIGADPACKDPSRLYRLPNVNRPEHGEQRSQLHGELGMWDYALMPKYGQPTALERLDAEALSCDRAAKDTRLGRAFAERGGLRELGRGKIAVKCPWADTHSDHGSRDPLSGGSVVFATNDGNGYFHCSHAHCVKRRQNEAFVALGLEAPWESEIERANPEWLRRNSADSAKPWFMYEGGVWRAVAEDDVYGELVKRTPALLGSSDAAKQVRLRTALLKQHAQHTMAEADLDPDPRVLCAPNGLIDLASGHLMPHSAAAGCSRRVGFPYDPSTDTRAVEVLILDWCGGKADVAAHLWAIIGYTVTGYASERLLTWLHGPPGTAKSSCVDLLAATLGTYAAHAVPAATWLDVPRKPADSIRATRGCRLVTSSELKGKAWDEDAILPFCGGEDVIRAEGKYKAQIQWRQQCKLWVTSNTAPAGASAALQDRTHVIPFETTYTADPEFKRTLPSTYGPAFLVRAVRAAGAYLAAGRLPARPSVVQNATIEATQDEFGGWLSDLADPAGLTHGRDLFSAWQAFAGSQAPRNAVAFGMKMREYSRLYPRKLKKDGAYYVGLALKPVG